MSLNQGIYYQAEGTLPTEFSQGHRFKSEAELVYLSLPESRGVKTGPQQVEQNS